MSKIKSFLILLISVFCVINAETEKSNLKVIDRFDSLEGWKILSEGITIDKTSGVKKSCIVLNYEFKGMVEWVVVSKEFDELNLPANFKFSFYIKGEGEYNNLEFKLLDNKGNVFWKKWEYFKFPDEWQKIELKKSDITFAWGPQLTAKL
ncbi:MAG: hypothetical protein AB1567_12715, partial [bacterium]